MFLELFITFLLVTGGESRHLLEASEAPPIHSDVPTLPEPILPVPKVEFSPMPEIPKVELPPMPEIPKIKLPQIPEIPKVELPQMPEIPKVELPPIPEFPNDELPPMPEMPKITIPEVIPKVSIPFAPLQSEENP